MMKAKRIYPLLLTFLLSLGVFLLLCRYDNKYAYAGLQPQEGQLDITPYSDSPFLLFLRDDWLFYPDQYLSPDDLNHGDYSSRSLRLGAYGGFEMGNINASPHGQGTYRLTIHTGAAMREYMMELPEIYTRYDLWVNGVHRRSKGAPGKADTLQSRISIEAAGTIDIVFAVADDNYLTSGMVYPPAFGDPVSVGKLLDGRLLLSSGAIALALLVAVFHLAVGASSRQIKRALLYALFCLSFILTISHIPAHTLGLPGRLWYALEAIGAYGVLWVLLEVGADVCRLSRPWRRSFTVCGLLMCLWAGLFPALYRGDSLSVLLLYSDVLVTCRWMVCLLLLGLTVFYTVRGRTGTLPLACGLCVYTAALLVDRLVIYYEPLVAFWPTESAALLLVLHLAWLHISDMIVTLRAKERAEVGQEMAAKSLLAQQRQYEQLAAHNENIRLLQHELRSHLLVMQSYCREERISELEHYISELHGHTFRGSNYCTHPLINAVLSDFVQEAHTNGIQISCEVFDLPATLPYGDTDLCTLLVNMLTNAIEACRQLPTAGWITIRIARVSAVLTIRCANNCKGPPKEKGGRLITSKLDSAAHGFGFRQMEVAAKNCKGQVSYRYEDGSFSVIAALPL